MDTTSFWAELESRLAGYDLLTHSFYQAWSRGELSQGDLKMYACEYYHHVDAFPQYLETLEKRLPAGKAQSAVAENRQDELGALAEDGRSHGDLWLDFAEGMGAQAEAVKAHKPLPQIDALIKQFQKLAGQGAPLEALSAFYTYESQVPRVAAEKAVWLKKHYGASATACKYFDVHSIADLEHARVWKELINDEIARRPDQAGAALDVAESTAKALWAALDGIEARRMSVIAH